MSENKVKTAVQQIISGTAAFQDSLNFMTFLFSEWRIHKISEKFPKI